MIVGMRYSSKSFCIHTISNVFFALSLTKGLAMIGIFSLALGCLSAPETLLMLYGTDMIADSQMQQPIDSKGKKEIQ